MSRGRSPKSADAELQEPAASALWQSAGRAPSAVTISDFMTATNERRAASQNEVNAGGAATSLVSTEIRFNSRASRRTLQHECPICWRNGID